MTDAATATTATAPDLKATADRLFARKRWIALAVPGLLLLYLVYVFFAFDIPGLAQRARLDNALTLMRDSYSYKTLVTRDNRADKLTVAIEGERKGTYPPGQEPDWVHVDGKVTRIELPKGAEVTYTPEAITFLVPDYGTVTAKIVGRKIETTLPPGPTPDWISASHTRLMVKAPEGRLTVTRARVEVARYFPGWEMFFFTLDSPYFGHSFADLASHVLSGQRIDPERGNLAGIWHDFWRNPVWRHAEVAWAIFETVLMAFLGTMGAGIIALPLAFLSARNFTPTQGLRFGMRRVFDFLRGVDGLIWTIILSRAFGPGALTGSLAILLTDTGSFGKIFSEALENVEEKQIDGIRSTGANAVQRYRFGVIPQVVPVLASQLLYFLESNTRSATIIGAIVGGGIGLLLTQAIITQKDWEEVAYYVILILAMVMVMDWISGLLRRRLIKGK
ncbi:phosphonate ABC transporter, permease protein PhnE [Acidimangrovimonas pyrenivorans]|uniref:Phosphonate ABC transporter, permease protein PhnE n=1 Tax=Acidimangrovimonas pyrenivorans TaxID=2030798 RepID=A0ABV7AHU8_9RHOB